MTVSIFNCHRRGQSEFGEPGLLSVDPTTRTDMDTIRRSAPVRSKSGPRSAPNKTHARRDWSVHRPSANQTYQRKSIASPHDRVMTTLAKGYEYQKYL